jgi:hypothetical protein
LTAMKIKSLTSAQVIARMRKGDILNTYGWGQNRGIFEDGTMVSHVVIRNLIKGGKINRPVHCSIHSPFTLRREEGRGDET